MVAVRRTLLNTTLALALLSAGPALAQSDSARLKRLETEVETLSRALYRGEAPPPGAMAGPDSGVTANMELRLTQLEATVRQMTGQLEQQDHQMRQMQERLDRVLSELDRRMVDVETRMRQTAGVSTTASTYPQPGYSDPGMPPASMGGAPAPSWAGGTAPLPLDAGDLPPMPGQGAPDFNAPATGVPGGQLGVLSNDPVTGQASLPLAGDSPAAFYEQAFTLLRERQYENAGAAFGDFLERWPEHELAANARYWLGETWYVRNNFERAARIFAEAYQKDTKGSKAPDNLLKLALSLNGMGKKNEACLTLAQLDREFGAVSSPVTARAKQESGRIACP